MKIVLDTESIEQALNSPLCRKCPGHIGVDEPLLHVLESAAWSLNEDAAETLDVGEVEVLLVLVKAILAAAKEQGWVSIGNPLPESIFDRSKKETR